MGNLMIVLPCDLADQCIFSKEQVSDSSVIQVLQFYLLGI